jgi:hypothetical protein
VLKRVASKNNLSSFATLNNTHNSNCLGKKCQHKNCSSGIELHEMGFHDRAAAHKLKITMRNAKCRLEWWKRILWSDEIASLSGSSTDESGFGG